jgi:hypothetical protein
LALPVGSSVRRRTALRCRVISIPLLDLRLSQDRLCEEVGLFRS